MARFLFLTHEEHTSHLYLICSKWR